LNVLTLIAMYSFHSLPVIPVIGSCNGRLNT